MSRSFEVYWGRVLLTGELQQGSQRRSPISMPSAMSRARRPCDDPMTWPPADSSIVLFATYLRELVDYQDIPTTLRTAAAHRAALRSMRETAVGLTRRLSTRPLLPRTTAVAVVVVRVPVAVVVVGSPVAIVPVAVAIAVPVVVAGEPVEVEPPEGVPKLPGAPVIHRHRNGLGLGHADGRPRAGKGNGADISTTVVARRTLSLILFSLSM